MAVLEPRLAILDETDSGLDIDALRIVSNGVNALRSPDRAIVVVTHYQRLLEYIVPDYVHVLSAGRIVRSGGKELALELEAKGYGWIETRIGGSQDVTMAHVAEQHGTLTSAFDAFRRDAAFGIGGLGPVRDAAFARFVEQGFPTTRLEEWRHTNVAPIAKTTFVRAPEAHISAEAAEPYLFAEEIPHRIVLMNGRLSTALSTLATLPAGVSVRSLRAALDTASGPVACRGDAHAEPHAVRRPEHGVLRGRRGHRHRPEDGRRRTDPRGLSVVRRRRGLDELPAHRDPGRRTVSGLHRRNLRRRRGRHDADQRRDPRGRGAGRVRRSRQAAARSRRRRFIWRRCSRVWIARARSRRTR